MEIWPRSLAGRTALLLLAGLATVQVAGLTIHGLDRVDVIRLAQERDVAVRAMSLYRSVALAPADRRGDVVREADARDDVDASLSDGPLQTPLPAAPPELQRQLRLDMALVPVPPTDRPRDVLWFGGPQAGRLGIAIRLPDDSWLNLMMLMPPPRPWHSTAFLAAFLLMTATAAGLTLWAVRRLIAPVETLAAAAERLGRDVNAPPLPEQGPTEVATAAVAFNTMAARFRRFLADRNFIMSAIGHDLRTPITRLKLRAEFIEDDEQRGKMLSDLDELEAMVSATLAFGRDIGAEEPLAPIDLAELVRTILDETGDTYPDAVDRLTYAGPDHMTVMVHPLSLKRALTNLISNAVKYGNSARVSLSPTGAEDVTLLVEDDGPGIPPDDIERVFQPFQRLESSRNRETGGVGLGLTIARNILRAHGGEVTLGNRPGGGARATVRLPV